jgi:hypothetical protein
MKILTNTSHFYMHFDFIWNTWPSAGLVYTVSPSPFHIWAHFVWNLILISHVTLSRLYFSALHRHNNFIRPRPAACVMFVCSSLLEGSAVGLVQQFLAQTGSVLFFVWRLCSWSATTQQLPSVWLMIAYWFLTVVVFQGPFCFSGLSGDFVLILKWR